MILVIDNYDSFTYNLVQALQVLGATVDVHRNDVVTGSDVLAMRPAGLVVSPGPCGPNESGNTPAIVRDVAAAEIPVLGVCLGHQVIGAVYGAAVERAPQPMHGKTAQVEHDSAGVFTNVPNPVEVGLYHSLAVVEDTIPPELELTAKSANGVVMGVRHRTLPVEGVQFHPESILTPDGETVLANFLRLATHPTAGWHALKRRATKGSENTA
jgi:anthranilate synthase/aminodeoxychorismate synthase-like glutamine amidotransferase